MVGQISSEYLDLLTIAPLGKRSSAPQLDAGVRQLKYWDRHLTIQVKISSRIFFAGVTEL
jgi:hypothetical protein